ncbi:uncharacterized protein JN550_005616 [Neoarthrinium moseri]|uniref:uncharacterized protein n=1 Tax=Neoarthrinium moseri TaxID=1658444 RepID=UPI001FDCE0C6|nr:uncharacterized protein JN550_005616 [Neoarthrinium moseri]KAI1869635.1 hypothetical protein JN550_005616 [Neoarthrinium moseri]
MDVSDISHRFASKADMRADCTEYYPMRFEKIFDHQQYHDDNDDRNKTSWERAIRTTIQGMSKKDIEHEIHRLDQTTLDVSSKKKTLGAALLYQLDKTMIELGHNDGDPNYLWTLVQFDHQLRPVDFCTAMKRDRVPLGQIKPKPKAHKSGGKRSSSTSAAKKKYWERVSLTAYFKRAPRPNVDVGILWDNKRRGAMAIAQGGGLPKNTAGGHPGDKQPGPPPKGDLANGPGPGAVGRPGPGGPPKVGPSSGVKVVNGKNSKPYREDRHFGGSETSMSSDDESFFSGPSTTSAAVLAAGVVVGVVLAELGDIMVSSRQGVTTQDMKATTSSVLVLICRMFLLLRRRHLLSKPTPPLLLQTASASDVERITDAAYRAGVIDERVAVHQLADDLAVEARPRTVPRIVQQPRHTVRTVDAIPVRRHAIRDRRYDDELTYFDELSMDDPESDLEWRGRRYEVPRRREYTFEDEDHLGRPLGPRRRVTEVVHGREEVPYMMEFEHEATANPFAPRLGRRRSYERRP